MRTKQTGKQPEREPRHITARDRATSPDWWLSFLQVGHVYDFAGPGIHFTPYRGRVFFVSRTGVLLHIPIGRGQFYTARLAPETLATAIIVEAESPREATPPP